MNEQDTALQQLGLRRTGVSFRMRHNSVTAQLNVPTGRGAFRTKAFPPIFRHESAWRHGLSGVTGRGVCDVLHETDEWWLAAAFVEPCDHASEDAILAIAKVQVAGASRTEELRAGGCPERALNQLFSDMLELAERGILMTPWITASLRPAASQVDCTLARVHELSFPATIVHAEFTPANTRLTKSGWMIHDSTNASVGHPVADLAVPLACARQHCATSRLDAFTDVWSHVMASGALERGTLLAPTLGVGHDVTDYLRIIDGITHNSTDQADVREMIVVRRYWVESLVDSVTEALKYGWDRRSGLERFGDGRFASKPRAGARANPRERVVCARGQWQPMRALEVREESAVGAEDVHLAQQLARIAAEVARCFIGRTLRTERKTDGSILSEADVVVEAAILSQLARKRPSDAVLTEERGELRRASRRRWLVDPIDGTCSFLATGTDWGTHLALELDGRIVLAVLTRPAAGRLWWAASGLGTHRALLIDPERSSVRVRKPSARELSAARVGGLVDGWSTEAAALAARARWVRDEGSPIPAYLDGRLEAVLDQGGEAWDRAPALLLAEEAGGAWRASDVRCPLTAQSVLYATAEICNQFESVIGFNETTASPSEHNLDGR